MSGAGMDSGLAVTIEDGAPTFHELAQALSLKDEAAPFLGVIQFQRQEESGDPPTWRTLGATGRYSAVTASADVAFLMTHPLVTRIRVLKISDNAPSLS